MNQHRPVLLPQHVVSNLDPEVRRDAQDVRVECAVMQRTQREPVGHDRLGQGMPVRQDLSRLEELLMPQAARGMKTCWTLSWQSTSAAQVTDDTREENR